MKKSALLVAFPYCVATETCPEPACGTVVEMLVVVAEETDELIILKLVRSLSAVASKLVPHTVTAVPGVPIVGVKPVIVGAPEVPDETVKFAALVAFPDGDVTAIGPVDAPDGTLTVNTEGLDSKTVPAVPLNMTVFCATVALNPVP